MNGMEIDMQGETKAVAGQEHQGKLLRDGGGIQAFEFVWQCERSIFASFRPVHAHAGRAKFGGHGPQAS